MRQVIQGLQRLLQQQGRPMGSESQASEAPDQEEPQEESRAYVDKSAWRRIQEQAKRRATSSICQ